MVQLLGKYQFLRQVVVALLSLCLAVPMPLFSRCACGFGASPCCSVHEASAKADRQLPSQAKHCCEHCKPQPTPARSNCCSDLKSENAPNSPCHCLLERVPDLSLTNSTDSLGLSLKSLANEFTIPACDLPVLVESTSSIERLPTRHPPSHQQRLALLGTWLN